MIENMNFEMSKLSKLYFLIPFAIAWIIYALLTGVFIFIKPKVISYDYISSSSVSDFYSDEIGPDRP